MKNTCRKRSQLLLLITIGCATIGLANAVAQNDQASVTNGESLELVTTNETTTAAEPDGPGERKWAFKGSFDNHGPGLHHDAVVQFGKDAVLKSNETAEAVVAIMGSAKVSGQVRDAVVAVCGDVTIDGGEIGDAVVAVLGNVTIKPGTIVHGEVVSVGGKVDVADGAKVEGHIQQVDFGGIGLPHMDWLKEWLMQCVFKLRPLALGPHLGWVWAVAGAFFLLYLLVAAAMPRTVEVCVAELTRRPATTFLMGLFTKILLPFVLLILAATGIGVIVIPFLFAALLFGALVGKAAFLEYLGQSLGRTFGVGAAMKPFLALLLGSVILVLLYLVPVLGLITFAVTGLWGLGAAVLALFGGMRRESPGRPMSPDASPMSGSTGSSAGITPAAPAAGATAFAASTVSSSIASEPSAASTGNFQAGTAPEPMAIPPSVSRVSEALTLPRASFWERMGAGFLDMIVVGILISLMPRFLYHVIDGPPLVMLVALAYFAGMWAWKGTTVGGTVLNLRVVRLDDKPVTFAVALVCGLAAVLSVMVLFLGFLWMIWDSNKQTWHDKIAGTVVVRQPKGLPLV